MEHHVRVSIVALGWGSVNISVYRLPAKIRPLLSRRERWIFNKSGMISDPYPLVGTSILYHLVTLEGRWIYLCEFTPHAHINSDLTRRPWMDDKAQLYRAHPAGIYQLSL